jgi:ribosomal protein S18 acetylase RimI-like enzyme
MKHVLDNPVWNALISTDKSMGLGDDKAKYFPPDVSPFAGTEENTPEHFQVLSELIPFAGPIGFFTDQKLLNPTPWSIHQRIDGFQMEYPLTIVTRPDLLHITDLDQQHVPEMLALTRLTNPGPFLPRTINFGNYQGIWIQDRLAAMAGQRLHVNTYTEISAVCTDPAFSGQGYARQLMLSQIFRIQSESCTPFLHVRTDNSRAIKIYQEIGFKIRKPMYIYILQKPAQGS